MVGGDLCERTAQLLNPEHWKCIGLRRRSMPPAQDGTIRWYRADMQNPESLPFLTDDDFPEITHILYAPSPDSRTVEHYTQVYALGFLRLLSSLALRQPDRLQRCILVGSSAVWGPSDDTVNEDTPVQNTDFRSDALLSAEAALHALLPPGIGVALRLSGLYGPERLRLVSGLRAGRITAPDGPGHWANRIHIDDAARACAHVLTMANPQPLYIATDDFPLPTAELYDTLSQLTGSPVPTRQPLAPSGKRLSNARLRASGWVPEWPNALEGYAACLAASEA